MKERDLSSKRKRTSAAWERGEKKNADVARAERTKGSGTLDCDGGHLFRKEYQPGKKGERVSIKET